MSISDKRINSNYVHYKFRPLEAGVIKDKRWSWWRKSGYSGAVNKQQRIYTKTTVIMRANLVQLISKGGEGEKDTLYRQQHQTTHNFHTIRGITLLNVTV